MTRQLLASFFLVMSAFRLPAQEGQPNAPKNQLSQARSLLKTLYSSSNPVKRQMVVNAMGIAATDRGVAGMLIDALNNDKDPTVRTVAASSMAEGRCRSCLPVLRHTLDDRDIVVAFAAAKALWALGDRSGLPLFEEVLSGQRKDSEGIIHGALLKAHRTMHDPSALALLGVNETVGIVFGPAGTALSFAEQGRKMSGGTAGRVVAAGFVGEVNSPETEKLLEDMLSDKDGSVVAASCKALAVHDRRKSLPLIASLMDDSRDIVDAVSAASVIHLTESRPIERRRERKSR